MAKDLPYFKFNVSEWNDGDITLCSLTAQGLFVNLCSLYWSQEGTLSLEKCKRRFKACNTTVWEELTTEGIIKVKGDSIKIKFLDIQFEERQRLSEINSKNIKKRWKKYGKDTVVSKSNNETKEPVYNIEEKRREEREIHSHGDGKISITVRKVFANDKIHKIHDLREYFTFTEQLDSLTEKGWIHFGPFMEANAGKVFNEPDHLYNSFRNFCMSYEQPVNGALNYSDAEMNRGLWKPEAWESHYKWKLDNDNEFRKHFGYAEL